MKLPGFLGGTETRRSRNVNAERSINVFPEFNQPGTPSSGISLYKAPGLKLFMGLAAGPTRALFAQDGRAFAVGGPYFYEIFANGSKIHRGTIAQDYNPATIHSNGTGGFQLFIVSGGKGYIYDLRANTLTQITAESFPDPCSHGEYVDGYFIALLRNSSQFFISNLFDGLIWEGLDTAQVSQVSDEVRSIIINHRELWMFGSKHTTPWFDSGNPSFPFQPIQGTVIHQGTDASYAAARFDNAILWLGQNEHGARMVWRAQGVTPVRVSTHAIEHRLTQAGSVRQALAFTYQQEGHQFYMLYVPDLETTLVYDVATNMWHERGHWRPKLARFEPHLARCHCYAFDRHHLVGDRRTGAVYEMSMDFTDENLVVAI